MECENRGLDLWSGGSHATNPLSCPRGFCLVRFHFDITQEFEVYVCVFVCVCVCVSMHVCVRLCVKERRTE